MRAHVRVFVWCFCARMCDLGGIGGLWGIVGLMCCCGTALIVTMAANEIENEMWKASTVGGAFQVSGFILTKLFSLLHPASALRVGGVRHLNGALIAAEFMQICDGGVGVDRFSSGILPGL